MDNKNNRSFDEKKSQDKRNTSIENLGSEYLRSADKARLRARKLELALKARDIKKSEMYNIHERIQLLYTQYRDTKKIGEKLISYYNNTDSITAGLDSDIKQLGDHRQINSNNGVLEIKKSSSHPKNNSYLNNKKVV